MTDYNQVRVGIDKIGLYIPYRYLDMVDLAHARQVDPDKYLIGIGQKEMAVNGPEEDIVAMAANAAAPLLSEEDRQSIDQVMLATESALDYSKAASVYVHELLNIQAFARCIEVKEACYAATAALMQAVDYVRLRPDRKVLVLASDIARYGLASGGEPTQGGGAVAMLISANPSILAIDAESVAYTTNQYDFWRPDGQDYPLVDGKFSQDLYLDSLEASLEEYHRRYPDRLGELSAMAFHVPFTKMARKAMDRILANQSLLKGVDENQLNQWQTNLEAGLDYSGRVGNIYTGSVYLYLISMLVNSPTLQAGDRLGIFSYGSGAVSEFISGQLQPGYQEALGNFDFQAQLDRRQQLDVAGYETLFQAKATEGIKIAEPASDGQFYLSQIHQQQRTYSVRD